MAGIIEGTVPKTITTQRLLERLHRAESAIDRHPPGSALWTQARDLADEARRAYQLRVDEITASRRSGEQ